VEQAREELRPLSSGIDAEHGETEGQEHSKKALVNGLRYDEVLEEEDNADGEEEEGSSAHQPPLLIASVIANSAVDTGEARQAAAKLERLGRDFQQEWTREQLEQNEIMAGEEGDG